MRTWQAQTETAESQYPSDWLPWLRRPSIPVAASLGREIISGGRQLGGGWGELGVVCDEELTLTVLKVDSGFIWRNLIFKLVF